MVYQLADRVFCVSHQLRELYAKRTGFPKTGMTVIHNGVDTTRFHFDVEARARMRHRFGVPPEAFCIGAIGRLEPVKDLATLLRAAEALAANGECRLIVAGDGSQLPDLRHFVESRRQLRDMVCFAGEASDVPAVLNSLDVYVLPSLAEGISNSLLEAMATGLPVIASNVGGNPEVVVDGEAGMLFPVGNASRLTDCLERLRNDGDLRRRLGSGATSRVKTHFSMQEMVRRYDELYSGLGLTRSRLRAEFDKPRGIHCGQIESIRPDVLE
jgi:glycosyltransferase involved in cell wall biosynthesis